MKKIIATILVLVFCVQTCVVSALEYRPKFSVDGSYGGRVIKSDFSLWEFEYKSLKEYLELEQIDSDVINMESNGVFRIKKDNTLWMHGFLREPKMLMPDVKSVCEAVATSSDYGYYVIKTDGSLWAWGSGRAGVPGAKTLYEDGERVDIEHENAVKIDDNVIYVYGVSGVVYYIKDDYTVWAFGNGYFPYYEDETEINKPRRIMDNVRYIDYNYIIKTDDSLWCWGWGIYKGNGEISNSKFTPNPVKVTDNVRSVHKYGYWADVAVKNDNTLWGWGVLGDPDSYQKYYWPIYPTKREHTEPTLLGTGVLDFCSYAGNYILKTDGSLWGYGVNFNNGVSEPLKIMQVMSVVINGDSVVAANEETTLSAKYYDKDGICNESPDVTWYCDNSSVLQITPQGSKVVVKGLKPGKAVVRAVHNGNGEMASFDVTVGEYKISLEDGYYFQREAKKELTYDVTFCGEKLALPELNLSWRVENTDGNPLKNFKYSNVDNANGSISFECADDGECDLIASVGGRDVKKIHIKVLGNLYELIEKNAMIRARMLSDSERYHYYKDTYISPAGHIVNSLKDTMIFYKGNNIMNNVFETGFTMESFYTIVLWNILESGEYEETNSGNKQTVLNSANEYILNIGAENIINTIELDRDINLSQITKNSVVDFFKIIDGLNILVDTSKDFEKSYAEMATLVTVTEEKIKVIETIMNTTDDKAMKRACQNILDAYQSVIYKIGFGISDRIIKGGFKSASTFLKEEVCDAVLDAIGAGAVSVVRDTVNFVLNTDDISKKAMLLKAYIDVEDAMKKGLEYTQKDFEKNPSYETASAFTTLADSYKALLLYECDSVVEYIDEVKVGDKNYSAVIWGDMTPDRSLTPFGLSIDYEKFKADVRETKKIISNLDFYLADMVDIAAYISEVRSTEPSSWAVNEINEAVEKDILPEYMCFNYTENITRAEFCTILSNMLVKKSGKSIEQLIDDSGVWVKTPFVDTCYMYVDYMYKLGIVNGTGGNCFSPIEEITREEAATMLTRAAKVLGYDTNCSGEVEDEVSDWAKDSVKYVMQNGIMNGTGNGFDHASTYTKEQAIITCLRMYNNL